MKKGPKLPALDFSAAGSCSARLLCPIPAKALVQQYPGVSQAGREGGYALAQQHIADQQAQFVHKAMHQPAVVEQVAAAIQQVRALSSLEFSDARLGLRAWHHFGVGPARSQARSVWLAAASCASTPRRNGGRGRERLAGAA